MKFNIMRRDLVKGGEKLLRRTRNCIQKVVPCNVLDPRVLAQEDWETFDVVLSSLCLEAATCFPDTYVRCVGHLSRLLNVGGQMVLCGVGQTSGYFVDGVYFPGLALNEDIIRFALKKWGLRITKWVIRENDPVREGHFRFGFSYALVAKRDEKLCRKASAPERRH